MKNNIIIENVIENAAVPAARIPAFAHWILESEGQQQPWTITFVFVDNRFIIDLNKRFFEKTTPTDVISFNLTDPEEEPEGEVYISVEMAAANAAEYDVTLENELLRLVAHGTYHVLGYDDTSDEERQNMTNLENKALEYIYSTL